MCAQNLMLSMSAAKYVLKSSNGFICATKKKYRFVCFSPLTGGELSSLLENFMTISVTPLCPDDVDK